METMDAGVEDLPVAAAPHSPEAERIVIGVLLADNAKFDELPEGGLSPEDFYQTRHQLIYQHMQMLYSERKTAADAITVGQSLTGADKLEEAGGHEYLGDLYQQGDFYPNFSEYARIVRDTAALRKLIDEARNIRDSAQNRGEKTADEVLDEAERRIFELVSAFRDHHYGALRSIDNIVKQVHDDLELIQQRIREKKSPYTGLVTGHSRLDDSCAGLQPGELIILAARPSVGKTAFALDLIRKVCSFADDDGKQRWAAFFSLEMSGGQLAMRIMSAVSGISSHRMRTGRLNSSDWERFMQAEDEIGKWGLYIDESNMLTINDLRSRSRRVKRLAENAGKVLSMIVVDYLQLMSGSDSGRHENRTLEVSSISRGLKALARELQVPVLALSQMSRKVEERGDRARPILSDLRESGSIEQDADLILFLSRTRKKGPEDPGDIDSIDMDIGKNRNGPVTRIIFSFDKATGRFRQAQDADDRDYQQGEAAMPDPDYGGNFA